MKEDKNTLESSENAVDLNGQWFGFYQYGPAYGPKIEGEKVIFSIIIDQTEGRSFTGKCVEINGIGSSTEIARLQGYIDDTFISFVKHYKIHHAIDPTGKETELPEVSSTRLMYSGTFDAETDTITGKWEIWLNDEDRPEVATSDVTTGTWEISRDPSRYGI
jgi:hypothetical protein